MRSFSSFLFLCRVSVSWEGREKRGEGGEGQDRPDSRPQFLVDPPHASHEKLPIGHDSCFSHKHFSLIVHGLIALSVHVCTFRRSQGLFSFERGPRYHFTVCLRSLIGLLHISYVYLGRISLKVPLRIFRRVGVCVCAANNYSIRCKRLGVRGLRLPLPFSSVRLSVHVWFKMRSLAIMIREGGERWGGREKGPSHFFLRLFCACMVG